MFTNCLLSILSIKYFPSVFSPMNEQKLWRTKTRFLQFSRNYESERKIFFRPTVFVPFFSRLIRMIKSFLYCLPSHLSLSFLLLIFFLFIFHIFFLLFLFYIICKAFLIFNSLISNHKTTCCIVRWRRKTFISLSFSLSLALLFLSHLFYAN